MVYAMIVFALQKHKLVVNILQQRIQMKNKMIEELQDELARLKHNQQEHQQLKAQLSKMQFKYEQLYKEKLVADQRHKGQRDSTKRIMLDYESQIDQAKYELNNRIQERNELEEEGIIMEQEISGYSQMHDALRQENQYLRRQQTDIENQEREVLRQVQLLKSEKQKWVDNLRKTQETYGEQVQRNRELEGLIEQTDIEKKYMKSEIITLDYESNRLQEEYHRLGDERERLQIKITQLSNQIKQINVDISEVKNELESSKTEIASYTKQINSEQVKNREYTKSYENLQHILKLRMEELQEIEQETHDIRSQIYEMSDINDKITVDNQHCEDYINVLISQNNYLIQQLQNLTKQDEQIIRLVNKNNASTNYKRLPSKRSQILFSNKLIRDYA